jgi:hypothetical protein
LSVTSSWDTFGVEVASPQRLGRRFALDRVAARDDDAQTLLGELARRFQSIPLLPPVMTATFLFMLASPIALGEHRSMACR